jgi:hypothetical protein
LGKCPRRRRRRRWVGRGLLHAIVPRAGCRSSFSRPACGPCCGCHIEEHGPQAGRLNEEA